MIYDAWAAQTYHIIPAGCWLVQIAGIRRFFALTCHDVRGVDASNCRVGLRKRRGLTRRPVRLGGNAGAGKVMNHVLSPTELDAGPCN